MNSGKKQNCNRRRFSSDLNVNTISSGALAAIFGWTGPALIIINGATNGGLFLAQTISWIFAVYFFGGVLWLIIALKNRQQIAEVYSIPGVVFVVGSLSNFSLSEASGAYLAAGSSSLFKELLGR